MSAVPACLKEDNLGGLFTKHFITGSPNGQDSKVITFDSLGVLKVVFTLSKDTNSQFSNEDEIIYKFEKDIVKESKIVEYNKHDLIVFVNNDGKTVEIMDMKNKNLIPLISEKSGNVFDAPIQQVQWHPLSVDKTLIILLENSSLLQYNILTNEVFHMNSESFNYKSEYNSNEARFSYDDLSQYEFLDNISSFTFGKNGLKLYLSDEEENDVYCIYPFFPHFEKNIQLDRKLMLELFNESYILYEQHMNDPECSVVDKKTLIKQMKFASKHLYDENIDINDPDFLKVHVDVEIPFQYRSEYGVQGPFQISPFPSKLYASTLQKVTTVDISNNNEILSLVFSDGSVFFTLEDLTIPMFWSSVDSENSESLVSKMNCSLVGLELLKLPCFDSGFFKDFKYITDGSIPHRLLLLENNQHENPEAILLDLIQWSEKLSESLNESSNLLNLNTIKSAVHNLSEVTSCAFVNDNQLVFTAKSSSSTPSSAYKYINLHKNSTEKGSINTTNKTANDGLHEGFQKKFSDRFITINDPKKFDIKYEHKISMKPYIQELNMLHKSLFDKKNVSLYGKESLVLNSKKMIPLVEIDDKFDEDIYVILQNMSIEIKERLLMMNNYGYKVHSILQKQEYEMKRQITTAYDLKLLTEKINSKEKLQLERYEKVINKYTISMKKFKSLELKLNEQIESASTRISNEKITSSEKQWFNELKANILSFNTMVLQQQSFNEQFDYLKTTLLKKHDSSDSSSKKDVNANNQNSDDDRLNFSELQKLLGVDKAIIENCTDQLLNAAKDLETKLKL